MKKYLITGILLILASCFLQAQGQNDCTPKEIEDAKRKAEEAITKNRHALDLKINEKTVDSQITNSHYVSRLKVSVNGFTTLANNCKKYGHKAGGDFDNWQKRNSQNTGYYMLYTVDAGKVYLYYEELDKRLDEQSQQYLPKGALSFDQNTYNAYFKGIDFSKNHWQTGGNVHARLADMQKLAVSIGKNIGVTIDPNKVTFKSVQPLQNADGSAARIYITGSNVGNDNIGAVAKWNDDMTSIEINGAYLANASISDVVNTLAEEVYHKYQMSELNKLYNAEKRENPEKAWDWLDSFNKNNKNDYGAQANNLQKQIDGERNPDKRKELEKQRDEAIDAYHNLAHEKDAKDFAGRVAAMEYFIRNNFKQD